MTLTITDLDTITLDDGSHTGPDDGYCLMEAISMFAKEPFTDHPKCVSPYLRAFGIRLNDRATDERRQDLRQFIPLVVGTAGDGLDEQRRWMAADHVVRVTVPKWLDRAGLNDHAATLRVLAPIVDRETHDASRQPVRAARDAAYALQREKLGGKTRYGYIYDAVKAKLGEKPVAVAVAGAVAVAVAVAVAGAVADADAVAVAVAVADAGAVADADAVAVAVAVAVAGADAVADAVAVAVAGAVAVADAAAGAVAGAVADAVAGADWSYGSPNYAKVRKAAYDAARALYEERYGDLIAESWDDAVTLYGRLINPALVSA